MSVGVLTRMPCATRRAERIGDGGHRQPQDGGEQLVVDPPAGGGRRPHDAPRGIGQRGEARR